MDAARMPEITTPASRGGKNRIPRYKNILLEFHDYSTYFR
jgi:hypothetical protein